MCSIDYHNRTEVETASDGFNHVSITKYRKDTIIPQIMKLIPCPEVVFLDYFSIPSGSITFDEQIGMSILSFTIMINLLIDLFTIFIIHEQEKSGSKLLEVA